MFFRVSFFNKMNDRLSKLKNVPEMLKKAPKDPKKAFAFWMKANEQISKLENKMKNGK